MSMRMYARRSVSCRRTPPGARHRNRSSSAYDGVMDEWRRGSVLVGLVVATAALGNAAACSLLVDTNADPCRPDADCRVAGTVCGPERICVRPSRDAGADAPAMTLTTPYCPRL